MPSAKLFTRLRLVCYHRAKAIPPISRTKSTVIKTSGTRLTILEREFSFLFFRAARLLKVQLKRIARSLHFKLPELIFCRIIQWILFRNFLRKIPISFAIAARVLSLSILSFLRYFPYSVAGIFQTPCEIKLQVENLIFPDRFRILFINTVYN